MSPFFRQTVAFALANCRLCFSKFCLYLDTLVPLLWSLLWPKISSFLEWRQTTFLATPTERILLQQPQNMRSRISRGTFIRGKRITKKYIKPWLPPCLLIHKFNFFQGNNRKKQGDHLVGWSDFWKKWWAHCMHVVHSRLFWDPKSKILLWSNAFSHGGWP